MWKTLRSIESIIQLGEGGIGVGDNGRAEHISKCKLGSSKVNDMKIDDGEIADNEVRKKDQKMSKCKKLSKSKKW